MPIHWHFHCRQNSARKRKTGLQKISTISVHFFLRAAHWNSQLWILHTFTLMSWLELYKCKSIRGCYFEVVVLFNGESLQAFLSAHFLLAANIPTSSVQNSTATEQTHLTPASSAPTTIKTIHREAHFKIQMPTFVSTSVSSRADTRTIRTALTSEFWLDSSANYFALKLHSASNNHYGTRATWGMLEGEKEKRIIVSLATEENTIWKCMQYWMIQILHFITSDLQLKQVSHVVKP